MQAEDPAKKLGFANVMGKILTKLDVRAIMGLLEDFASGIPETLQTVCSCPHLRLVCSRSIQSFNSPMFAGLNHMEWYHACQDVCCSSLVTCWMLCFTRWSFQP